MVAGLYTDSLGDPPLDTYEAIIRRDADLILDALDGGVAARRVRRGATSAYLRGHGAHHDAGIARPPRSHRLGVFLAVVAALGHDAVFAARYGLGRELAAALRRGGHDGWWGPLALAVVAFAGLVVAVQVLRVSGLSRRTAPRRRRRRPPPSPPYLREWLRLWAVFLRGGRG